MSKSKQLLVVTDRMIGACLFHVLPVGCKVKPGTDRALGDEWWFCKRLSGTTAWNDEFLMYIHWFPGPKMQKYPSLTCWSPGLQQISKVVGFCSHGLRLQSFRLDSSFKVLELSIWIRFKTSISVYLWRSIHLIRLFICPSIFLCLSLSLHISACLCLSTYPRHLSHLSQPIFTWQMLIKLTVWEWDLPLGGIAIGSWPW